MNSSEVLETTKPDSPIVTDTMTAPNYDSNISHARLLMIDDEAVNLMLLTDMLEEAGFTNLFSTTNPFEAVELFRQHQPDIVLLDLMMPGLDGFQVMELLKAETPGEAPIPVLVLTADASMRTKQRALEQGAKDFLTKPLDMVEVRLRIGNLLETRLLQLKLWRQNQELEERVRARTYDLELAQQRILKYAEELKDAHLETLERMAIAAEFRDDDTGQHTERVAVMTATLAEKIGLDAKQIELIRQAARLHDVGKIGISDTILLKPGKLTNEEFDIIKTHTTIGALMFENAKSDLIQLAQLIARSHHERWDGSGYPDRIAGEDIPIEARLLSVADVFDALTHDRPYKKAWPLEEAIAEISKQSGRQFDPQVIEAFLTLNHAEFI